MLTDTSLGQAEEVSSACGQDTPTLEPGYPVDFIPSHEWTARRRKAVQPDTRVRTVVKNYQECL